MQETSIKLNYNTKGFTLVELLTSTAIMGILATVGIQQYTQYKVRGYDVHSKQALHDMNLSCKAYWTENKTSDECDLAKTKEHGFIQGAEVVANVLSPLPDKFCTSAKHSSSPNTFSADSVGLISDNADCGTGLAAELAAKKVEAKRIAEIKKYNSCDNFQEETGLNKTLVTFVPNKHFSSNLQRNPGGISDISNRKGYCVYFSQTTNRNNNFFLRRPGIKGSDNIQSGFVHGSLRTMNQELLSRSLQESLLEASTGPSLSVFQLSCGRKRMHLTIR